MQVLWSGMLCVFKQQLLMATNFLREKPGRARVVELICAITISLSKSFVDEQRSTQRIIKQNEAAQTVYHSHRERSSRVWDWPQTNLSGATSGKQNSKREVPALQIYVTAVSILVRDPRAWRCGPRLALRPRFRKSDDLSFRAAMKRRSLAPTSMSTALAENSLADILIVPSPSPKFA
jgi:hypothetical protein